MPMAVVCRAYTTHAEARGAVDALLADGIPGTDLRVLMGEPPRDARRAPEGEFATTVAPEAIVGGFGGAGHRHDAGAGAFVGAAGAQRGGSFADADRETVTSYPDGVERVQVAGHRQVRRILRDAGLDEPTVDRDAEALHGGRILVLADVGDRDARDVGALLDRQFQASRERADQ
jgi:hypothetical protein